MIISVTYNGVLLNDAEGVAVAVQVGPLYLQPVAVYYLSAVSLVSPTITKAQAANVTNTDMMREDFGLAHSLALLVTSESRYLVAYLLYSHSVLAAVGSVGHFYFLLLVAYCLAFLGQFVAVVLGKQWVCKYFRALWVR